MEDQCVTCTRELSVCVPKALLDISLGTSMNKYYAPHMMATTVADSRSAFTHVFSYQALNPNSNPNRKLNPNPNPNPSPNPNLTRTIT